uniref:Putative transposase n=1 Tax=Moniliophthora roreri TaxID=221103 RepID=A0A0W0F4W4_MONRR
MSDLDKEEWRLAVFSDEKKLTVFNGDGHRYCRRRVDKALEPSKLQKMVPHEEGSIMVWGCLTLYGPGRLVWIEGTMTGKKYTEVLEEGYLGTLGDYGIPHDTPNLLFQQDYDLKHTSKTAADWIDCYGIKCLLWAAKSPDINIMENAWAELDRRIQKRVPLPTNKEQLWEAAKEEWAGLDMKYIDSLYNSLPECIDALLAANRHSTCY